MVGCTCLPMETPRSETQREKTEAVVARIDRMLALGEESMRVDFDGDDDDFTPVTHLVREHLVARRATYEAYEFWTYGLNYANADYICARRIREDNPPRSGSCWMSPVWPLAPTNTVEPL